MSILTRLKDKKRFDIQRLSNLDVFREYFAFGVSALQEILPESEQSQLLLLKRDAVDKTFHRDLMQDASPVRELHQQIALLMLLTSTTHISHAQFLAEAQRYLLQRNARVRVAQLPATPTSSQLKIDFLLRFSPLVERRPDTFEFQQQIVREYLLAESAISATEAALTDFTTLATSSLCSAPLA